MAKSNSYNSMGKWAFMLGVIIAVLMAFVNIPYSGLLLVILGLFVGLVNIAAGEVESFLIAVIALLVVGLASVQAINTLPIVGNIFEVIQGIVGSLISFVAPAALIVALKQIYALASK